MLRGMVRFRLKLASWLVLATAGIASSACAAATPGKAVWIWEADSYGMLENEATASEAIAFLRREGFDTAYLYADAWRGRNLIASDPAAYRALIAAMHRNGVKVHALLGSWYLGTHAYVLPAHRADALAMLDRVLAYDATAAPDERFDGIGLDIEPHVLDAWDVRRDELLADFLDLSAALRDRVRAAPQPVPLGAAIPFWLDGITLEWRGRRDAVSAHAIGLYDYVAIMDYRNHADGGDGIVGHAETEMAQARAAGHRVVIGLEVAPNELAKVTFDGLRPADLDREMAATARAFAAEPAFGGFAIHHYGAYRRWLMR
jgi:hypothetical protein